LGSSLCAARSNAVSSSGDVWQDEIISFCLGFLKVAPKATGGDAQRTRFHKSTESTPTLADLGLTKKESAAAQQVHVLRACCRWARTSDGFATRIYTRLL
jgi:hypothetical protein